MTKQNQSKIKREFLKAVWAHTKSPSLVRECKAIYDGCKIGALL